MGRAIHCGTICRPDTSRPAKQLSVPLHATEPPASRRTAIDLLIGMSLGREQEPTLVLGFDATAQRLITGFTLPDPLKQFHWTARGADGRAADAGELAGRAGPGRTSVGYLRCKEVPSRSRAAACCRREEIQKRRIRCRKKASRKNEQAGAKTVRLAVRSVHVERLSPNGFGS